MRRITFWLTLGLLAAVLLAIPPSLHAQATIPVSGNKVVDNNRQPLTGRLVFTVTDTANVPVTYTPQGGAPTTAAFTLPVVNGVLQNIGGFPPTIANPLTMSPANTRYRIQTQSTGGGTTYFTFPLTNISTSNFSYDGYIAPAGITITGAGIPTLNCNPSAMYNNTLASDPYPWVCSKLQGDASLYWTQNPSLNPACSRGNNQAIASAVNGTTFCIDASQAFVTPGFVWAGPLPGQDPTTIGLVPLSTLCASGDCGTASAGGLQTQIQYNNGTSFGGAKTTTDLATGLQLNTPILNGAYDASKFQSSPGANNGIANAEAAAGVNGVTVANPNYPITESGSFSTGNSTLIDLRGGAYSRSVVNPYHGLGFNSINSYNDQCYFDDNANPTATDTQFCHTGFNLIAGIGNDAGGGVTKVGGDLHTTVMVSNGITAVDEQVIDCWKDGDCHAHRDTFATQGLNSDLSREGFSDFTPHFFQEPFIFNSNVVSVTDSTHIKTNPTNVGGAYGTQLGGGWLVNKNNIDSGNITADNNASGGIVNRRFITSTTHPVSTAWGATTTVLNGPANYITGSPTSVTVTKIGGTWPASGNVCISGNHTYETTYSGAADGATVTMTILSRYEEPIGSTFVVGSCTKMFSNVDRLINFQNGGTTSEISPDIIGAPDANTYFYTLTGVATRDGNALNGSYNWQTDLTVNELPGNNVTRDASNNVSFPDDSTNNGFGYRLKGTRTITVANCANTNFNFGPTVININVDANPFNLAYVQPGAIVGAASTNGCTITMSGLNGFTLHKAAKVISASDPTVAKNVFPFTGYYLLGTNTVGWTAGDPVEQPSGNSILIDQISEVAGMTPTNGGQPSHPILDWSCKAVGLTVAGQCSGGMTPILIANQAPYSMYRGGGGHYIPMTLGVVQGVWGNMWNYISAPANGGIFTQIGCPPEGCNSAVPYSLFTLGGTFNSSITYNPSIGQVAVNSASFFTPLATANDMKAFTFRANTGLLMGFINGATNFQCISFVGRCANANPNDANIIADAGAVTGGDPNMYIAFPTTGNVKFRTLASGFTYNWPCSISATVFDCSVGGGDGTGTGASAKFTSLTISGIATLGASSTMGGSPICTIAAGCGSGSGVLSINGASGAFTFSGSGVSCTTITCTFSGTGTGVASFNGRTGAIAPASGDYSFSLLSGSLAANQGPALTGLLKDVGGTLSAAIAGTDYVVPTGSISGNAATASSVPYSGLTGTVTTWNQNTNGNAATATLAANSNAVGGVALSSLCQTSGTGCPASSGGNTTSTSLTTNTIPKANGPNSIINSGLTDDGTKLSYVGSGTANGMQIPEGTAIAGLAASDNLWSDSTTHRWMMNNNATGAVALSGLIASGTATLGTSAIASGPGCPTVTIPATGVVATDVITWNPNTALKTITGYVPSTSGGLTIQAYPTSGNVNFDVCNWTAASITPGAVTLNWKVTR